MYVITQALIRSTIYTCDYNIKNFNQQVAYERQKNKQKSFSEKLSPRIAQIVFFFHQNFTNVSGRMLIVPY